MGKINIEEKILSKNIKKADALRELFREKGVFVLNLVSSPGSGKTSILESTLTGMQHEYNIGVIEGDLQTENDAERIRKTGINAVQINTGGACHLEAEGIGKTLKNFDLDKLDFLVIENVGNLVCPSSFDLGEDCKVVVVSTPEGDDKPAKYPSMIRVSSAMIVNKIDLLDYLDFDIEKCIDYARGINPDMDFFKVSCMTGEGIGTWTDWLTKQIGGKKVQQL
ncbi:MAG TPA: hydrogenase accessory protein HypB [Flexistipes sinusarabici]|uniref:Hydrogenase accessory protein HypB n=1 Tax=Flexistipes sinusarabici TaxID=2352 RepID=A0A3D5QBX4_FLESI|nr:hydrogenase accessory protein HypB [Flexistipes sinusarabici]